jgi:hypothetical protein
MIFKTGSTTCLLGGRRSPASIRERHRGLSVNGTVVAVKAPRKGLELLKLRPGAK